MQVILEFGGKNAGRSRVGADIQQLVFDLPLLGRQFAPARPRGFDQGFGIHLLQVGGTAAR